MEPLYSLVRSLSEKEFVHLKRSFSAPGENGEGLKSISLLEFLRESESEPSKEAFIRKVYGKSDDSSFRKLKSRLKHRLLESLISDTHIENLEIEDPQNAAGVKLRKQLSVLSYLYYSKGNILFLQEFLDDIIKKAEEFNVYIVLIDALKLKKALTYLRGTAKEVEEIQSKLDYYYQCDQARDKASNYYNNLIRKVEFTAGDINSALQQQIISSISDLNTLYENMPVPSVRYFQKRIEMAYFSNSGNLDMARETCHELLELLNLKEFYKKERIGMVYDNLGQLDIRGGNFKNAIKNFRTAQSYFKKGSINLNVSMEQEFLALYYNSDLTKANEVLDSLFKGNIDQGEIRLSKFYYYKASIHFAKGQFFEAHKVLRKYLEIGQDKAGWDISIRILSIMSCIELNYLDQASMEVHSLKKHIERTRKKSKISDRMNLVFKALLLLERNGFQFQSSELRNSITIQELSSEGNSNAWKVLTPELVKVHLWLEAKFPKSRRKDSPSLQYSVAKR